MQRQKIASFFPAKIFGWLKDETDIRQINRGKPILITCMFMESNENYKRLNERAKRWSLVCHRETKEGLGVRIGKLRGGNVW